MDYVNKLIAGNSIIPFQTSLFTSFLDTFDGVFDFDSFVSIFASYQIAIKNGLEDWSVGL